MNDKQKEQLAQAKKFTARFSGMPIQESGKIRYLVTHIQEGTVKFETDSSAQAESVRVSTPGTTVIQYDANKVRRPNGLDKLDQFDDSSTVNNETMTESISELMNLVEG